MAVLVVCSVRDSAVGAFVRPFYCASVGEAVRSFSDEVARSESPMAKHPADYELFELGVFDEENAHFELLDRPRAISRAKDHVPLKE